MKKIPIKVCGHYVLIKPEKMKKKTKSGLILPDAMVNKENVASVRGTLVGVGDNAWKAFDGGDPWAEIGDKVYFKRHVSDRIQDDTDKDEDGEPQEYFLMADENILAVIED
jgi:co-chaperonin GroES (HSP10)